jgi:hypothetical protein
MVARPVRAGPLRGWVDASGLEDRPDGGAGDLVAESDALYLDASVDAGRVFGTTVIIDGTPPG